MLTIAPTCIGQDFGDDVEALTLTSVSPTISRLTWKEVASVECETKVTYSVFRGTSEEFTPSLSNQIASGLTKATYLAKEPTTNKDYYYYVKFLRTSVTCLPQSGGTDIMILFSRAMEVNRGRGRQQTRRLECA